MSDKQYELTGQVQRMLQPFTFQGRLPTAKMQAKETLQTLQRILTEIYLERGYGREALEAIQPIEIGSHPNPYTLVQRGYRRIETRMTYLRNNICEEVEKDSRSLLENAYGICLWLIALVDAKA